MGESLAANYLVKQGCTILARNWRASPGEIDIVARCPLDSGRTGNPGSDLSYEPGEDMLAFIEVRTRHGAKGRAEESISRRKAAGMASAALHYIYSHNLDPDSTPWRIDVLAVAVSADGHSTINWVQGAIGALDAGFEL
jgi:putative endonuclease